MQCVDIADDKQPPGRVGNLFQQFGEVVRSLIYNVMIRIACPFSFYLFVSHPSILIRAWAEEGIIFVASNKKGPAPDGAGPFSVRSI